MQRVGVGRRAWCERYLQLLVVDVVDDLFVIVSHIGRELLLEIHLHDRVVEPIPLNNPRLRFSV